MKTISWSVKYWIQCQLHLGKCEEERAEKSVLSYARSNGPKLSTFQVHKIQHNTDNKNWPQWYLYCYFSIGEQNIIDIADAVPIQKTEQGKIWEKYVDLHFKIFGMPWRIRPRGTIYSMMITGGEKAVESYKDSLSTYVRSLKIKPDVRDRFQYQLQRAETWLIGYYHAMNNEDHEEAIITLDHAVFILHDLIFDIGKELGFMPPRSLEKI